MYQTWLARAACAASGGAVGAAVTDPLTFSEFVHSLLPGAVAALAKPASAVAAAAVAPAVDAQTAALIASVRAIEAVLVQQRTRTSLRLMLLAGGGALAFVALRFCWEECGWATPSELKTGLAQVGASVRASAAELKETLLHSFGLVDERMAEVSNSVQEVKGAVTAEVHTVSQKIASLEERLAPIENNVKRTAQGVDLLCEVVAGLSSNASPDLLRRLGSFTGSETHRLEAPAPTRISAPALPAARPELLAPSTRPEFLQSILSVPPARAGVRSM